MRKIRFLDKSVIRPLWQLSDNTCTAVDVDELSMAKTPPKLGYQELPPPAPKPPPRPKRDATDTLIALENAFFRYKAWLNAPPAPKPAPAPVPAPRRSHVKPFDLLDIPGAMDAIGWPVAAKIQRRWFAGTLNYANTDEGAVHGINQNGQPFPSSMIDTTTCTLDWILRFPRAKEAFELLQRPEWLFSGKAINALNSTFRKVAPTSQCLSTWKVCSGNIDEYHRRFHFQHITVDTNFISKSKMAIKGSIDPLWMDDLYGALGAFSFYVAVDSFSWLFYRNGRARLEIYGLSIYARDVFTFLDRSDQKGTQYLGHWNKTGFIVIPEATIAGELAKSDGYMYPVAVNNLVTERKVYYPVRNKDYRNWQIKHQQGGDFIIYSNRVNVPLSKTVVFEFDA